MSGNSFEYVWFIKHNAEFAAVGLINLSSTNISQYWINKLVWHVYQRKHNSHFSIRFEHSRAIIEIYLEPIVWIILLVNLRRSICNWRWFQRGSSDINSRSDASLAYSSYTHAFSYLEIVLNNSSIYLIWSYPQYWLLPSRPWHLADLLQLFDYLHSLHHLFELLLLSLNLLHHTLVLELCPLWNYVLSICFFEVFCSHLALLFELAHFKLIKIIFLQVFVAQNIKWVNHFQVVDFLSL